MNVLQTNDPLAHGSESLRERLDRIRVVALDVDGVLTDGGLLIGQQGELGKRFHVRDGMGMRLLMEAGIRVGLITARYSRIVTRRAAELDLTFVHQGIRDKWDCLASELNRQGIPPDACAFMGDDLQDLRVMSQVGLSAAPADGARDVRERVHWVSACNGGQGAVRDLAEWILRTQGRWSAIVEARVQL
jgi:3-deoxy-D-manno-octulosonate 8-phosphate phosphatase (KDO 8-P phosphatase)